jgi:phosphoribosylamine-glycine ligase
MGGVMTGVPRARLRVEVARPARPSSTAEPMVLFTAEGRTYAVRVEEEDLDDDLLRVAVVHEDEDRVLVEIPGLPAETEEVKVFHAGTALRDGHVVTAGGRVLCVTALGDSTRLAQQRAYEAVHAISFAGALYRHDIGQRAIRR